MYYTIKDYIDARNELKALQDRFDNYSGNNPNKYRSDINAASCKLRAIEWALKSEGFLDKNDIEKIECELDAAFPDAKSKQIVDYEGKKYMRIFFPARKSRSGKTVTEWMKSWRSVEK